MLFNSIDFAIFLPLTFLLYWFIFKNKLLFQNSFLIFASYLFYGWWDWRFLTLIFFSSILDYFLGIEIYKSKKKYRKKIHLFLSLIFNLGVLGLFKYYNFFIDSFNDVFSLFGNSFNISQLNIILPVGISFYTFQTLSYTIDVYKNKIKPTKNIIAFMAFICFFPQLVAGPIERASNLLPQFFIKRNFNYSKAVDGLRQILFGLFKKMVIADNCAIYANNIFDNYEAYPGSTLFIGAIFFTFQIYGDFSGYSDIAIGTSRLFGFNLKQNFAFPYFSRNIAEFWRRWHMSLSTWFRDYLYIPLGGSRGGKYQKIKNTFIIFTVSGLWHGANWTFIFWGVANAMLFIPLQVRNKNRIYLDSIAKNQYLPDIKVLIKMLSTFIIVTLLWIIFRSNTINDSFSYFSIIFSNSIFTKPFLIESGTNLLYFPKTIFIFILFMLIIEWLGRNNKHALEKISIYTNSIFRCIFYLLLCLVIVTFKGSQQDFIYFQF